MAKAALSRRLAQQLDRTQCEFVQLADVWLARPDAVDTLHDLRVAWRRLRAVLNLLRRESTLQPSAEAAKEAMAALMRSSSPIRDLDVLPPQLQPDGEASQELAPLVAVITAQRSERAAWLAAHWRPQQLLMAAAMEVLRRQLQATTLPRDFYDDELARREKQVRHALQRCADMADAQSWHRLRIRCKQWRYTLELFAAEASQGKRLRRLRELQRHLGDAQDAATAITLLSQLASSALPAACLLAMGRQQYRLEQQRLRALERAQRKLQRMLDV